MNDTAIEKTLINAFLNLNQFMSDNGYTGSPYITMKNGKPTNVSMANQSFTEPADKRYFALDFLPSSPEPMGLGENAENLYAGILQIDIITPLGTGTAEVESKLNWVCKLFGRGKMFGDVMVMKTYRAMSGAEPGMPCFRTILRVEWRASLPNN
jgi:hypothetical protein